MKISNWLVPLFVLAAFPFAGCSSSDDSSPGDGTTNPDERRTPIGKADSLSGKCLDNGVTYCGGKSKKKCWCDAECTAYGDCCADYKQVCASGTSCKSSADCASGEYCQAPEGCGAPGVCKPTPTNLMCLQVITPYCTCEGETKMSNNSCILDRFAHKGACETQQMCGGIAGIQCPSGQVCVDNPNDSCDPNNGGADCGGICVTKTMCGGIAGIPCPTGQKCVDDPTDSCNPAAGGADCSGICVPSSGGCAPVMCALFCENGFKKDANGCQMCACNEAAGNSCSGHCGGPSGDKSCYCDTACKTYGDCCADYAQYCGTRTPASGACVKNSNDACSSDADCKSGGCGGELCYNPAVSSGISTCECTAPTNVAGCGCVAGKCTWYN